MPLVGHIQQLYKEHTREEKLKIKVLYSRLRRSINHSNMKKLLPYHVAEHIWKYGKDFDELKDKIYQMFNLFYNN